MMKKYIILVAMCQVFFTPVILSVNIYPTSEQMTEMPSHSGDPYNTELPSSYQWEFMNSNNSLMSEQSILMAPPLPGDVGGELEVPVGDSWIVVLVLACIYTVICRVAKCYSGINVWCKCFNKKISTVKC